MIKIDAGTFLIKIHDTYYNKIYDENLRYYEEHGIGPYAAFSDRFQNRIAPYLDAGYNQNMIAWIEKEFNTQYDTKNSLFLFENEEDAIWFAMKWT